MTYDLEMPRGLQPLCSDGEVEEFRLISIGEMLRSLRDDLPLWKPNSARIHHLTSRAHTPYQRTPLTRQGVN